MSRCAGVLPRSRQRSALVVLRLTQAGALHPIGTRTRAATSKGPARVATHPDVDDTRHEACSTVHREPGLRARPPDAAQRRHGQQAGGRPARSTNGAHNRSGHRRADVGPQFFGAVTVNACPDGRRIHPHMLRAAPPVIADPRTTTVDDRRRQSFDKHVAYVVGVLGHTSWDTTASAAAPEPSVASAGRWPRLLSVRRAGLPLVGGSAASQAFWMTGPRPLLHDGGRNSVLYGDQLSAQVVEAGLGSLT